MIDFLTLVDQQESLGVQLTTDEPCSHSHLKPNPNKFSTVCIAQQRSKITIWIKILSNAIKNDF
jgi:hypothetical protein